MSTLPYPLQPVQPHSPGALRQFWHIARRAWMRPTSRNPLPSATPLPSLPVARNAPAAPTCPTPASTMAQQTWPLRVVRVVDMETAGTPSIGRMRISGRMADVCAELDRLVEREAAFQRTALPA